jgi:hypothetical protein
MPHKLKYIVLLLICLSARAAFAQYPTQQTNPGQQYPGQPQRANFSDTTQKHSQALTTDQEIDTLRKKEDLKRDSVIFTAKFIKITNEELLKDSTQVFPIDTGLTNFENYSPLYQPSSPRIGLGNLGLDQKPLLFEPDKTIGFDPGLHTLDIYLLNPEDINYYNARVPYTVLSMATGGGRDEQVFKVLHTQNIKPNWNVGFNLNFIGSQGYYGNTTLEQNVSDVNVAFFTWYQSLNKRYNLIANLIYNNLKAPETGSVLDDSVFSAPQQYLDKTNLQVRLPNTFENWKNNGFYIKQSYYIGHIDSVKKQKGNDTAKILPTERVAYSFYYNVRKYNFLQNDQDYYNVFPDYYFSENNSRDSLTVIHYRNDFSYSFYLRSKAAKSVKNEAKLDVGLTQDLYHYTQFVADSAINQYGDKVIAPVKVQDVTFQDLTVWGKISYRLSNKIDLEGNVHQIVQGRDFGNFIYEGKLLLAGNNKEGKIILDAYSQNTSPPLVYTDWVSNHYIFHNSFSNQKTNSASFNYINNALQLNIKAEYYFITDYLYFTSDPDGTNAHPAQLGEPVNVLKVTLSKNLEWRRWHFDNLVVYQKTDNESTLRTPAVYSYSSLYYSKLLFQVLNTSIGTDVRYNSPYQNPSYAVGLGEFYNGPNITFSSYPVANVFLKATLMRTNLFVAYNYANQGLFSKGFYTVNRYPMQDHLLTFGVSWGFFN